MTRKRPLERIWRESLGLLRPEALLREEAPLRLGEAALFWGKAALEFCRALRAGERCSASEYLVIVPGRGRLNGGFPASRIVFGEHPLPGEGSFRAGQALVEFFGTLRERRVKRLRVFLSGGASSLAWVRPWRISHAELARELEHLYAAGLPIRELNRRRAKLCALKAGGSARWLKKISPSTRVSVSLVSDVAPYGPEVVGSGPFFDGRVPHRVLADNASWVRSLARLVQPERVLSARHSSVSNWQDWVREISREIDRAKKPGLILFGGEPSVALPKRAGRGGRQTQVALALFARYSKQIAAGQVEILCASSDGVDGRSGSSATLLNAETTRGLSATKAARALKRFDSARFLRPALIPSFRTGTNVQDAVIVRAIPRSKSFRSKQP